MHRPRSIFLSRNNLRSVLLRFFGHETRALALRLMCVVISLSATRITAQEHVRLGVTGGYSYGRPTSIDRKLGAIETFGADGQGTSFENDLEFGARLELPNVFGGHSNLLLSLAYIRGNGEFKSRSFLDSNAESVMYRVTSLDDRAYVDGAMKQEILPWLSASGGVWASYRVRDSLSEETLKGTITKNVQPRGTLATSRFHFGIPLAFGAKLTLSNKFALEPEAFARVDLGEVFRGFSQDAFSIGGRLSLTLDLTPSVEETPKPVTQPPPHLHATVHFEVGGVSADHVTSGESDTIIHRYVMLPAAHSQGAAGTLPQAGASLNDIVAAAHAIVAQRLDSLHPKMDDLRLFAPYVDQWQEKSSIVPNITISKYIESEAGVRSWQIDVERNGAAVVTLSDDSSLNSGALDRVFNYSGGGSRDTIVARLQAVDVKGTHAIANDTLVVTSSTTPLGTTVKDQFYIICDTSLALASWKQALISRAAHSSNEKSTITISPLAPVARECSHQVAAELLAILAKEHVAVQGVHEVSAFSNATIPAQYERGVLIEVVSPAN